MGKKHHKRVLKAANKLDTNFIQLVEDDRSPPDCPFPHCGKSFMKLIEMKKALKEGLNPGRGADKEPVRIPKDIYLKFGKKRRDAGIFFGGWKQYGKKHFIGMPQCTDGNVMIVGGNGSGKSSGIIMPTLETWTSSFVALDVKGELYDSYYSYLLASGSDTLLTVFDPMRADGPSYDPFYWLDVDGEANLVSNLQTMANALISKSPHDPQPFWVDTTRGVLAAALLYYWRAELSFSEAISMILSLSTGELSEELGKRGDDQVKLLLGQASDMGKKAVSSIDRELRNHLMVFASDPFISHAFRGRREGAHIFSWDGLEDGRIFLRVPEDRTDLWQPAINLMFTQLIQYLERRPEKFSAAGYSQKQVLVVMDEFARIGKLENIVSALATLRSKSVNFLLAIQSIAQLDKIYGEYDRRILFDNCQWQAILRANDAETQRYLADLIGTRVCKQRSASVHLNSSRRPTGYSVSIGENRELLIQPHELACLANILLLTPYGFFQVDKLVGTGIPRLIPVQEVDHTNRLTTEQRLENAKRKFSRFQQQDDAVYQPPGMINMSCHTLALGKLLSIYYPECEEVPGDDDENAIRREKAEILLQNMAGIQNLAEQPGGGS